MKKIIFTIILLSLLVFSGCGEKQSENQQNINQGTQQSIQEKSNEKIINSTFIELHNRFFLSGASENEQKQFWSEIVNKKVKWEGYIKNIDYSGSSEYDILCLKIKPEQIKIGSDVGLSLKNEEKSKLANFYEGDKIEFEGILKDYGNIVNSKIFYLKDVILIGKKEEIQNSKPITINNLTTEETARLCQTSQIECSIFVNCDKLNNLKEQGVC